MTEQVMIDGVKYDANALSDSCRELLVRVQNTNQGMALIGSVLEAARAGNETLFNDAKKLLPEPSVEDEDVVEDETAH
jgi:hypothetical protein